MFVRNFAFRTFVAIASPFMPFIIINNVLKTWFADREEASLSEVRGIMKHDRFDELDKAQNRAR